MNKHEAAELGVRLIAILSLTTLTTTMPGFFLTAMGVFVMPDRQLLSFGGSILLLFLANIAGPLVTFAILWFKAPQIAQRFWSSQTNLIPVSDSTPVTSQQLQSVVFSGIGLFLLINALPSALRTFANFIQEYGSVVPYFGTSTDWGAVAAVFGYVVQIIISAWLLFNSPKLAETLHVQRNLEADKEDD